MNDDMIAPTRAPRVISFQAQVLDLEPGDSVSRVKGIDRATPVARLGEELPAIRQQLRNAIAPAVARAREQTGGTYMVETGDMPTPSGNFYVVAVVTRTS